MSLGVSKTIFYFTSEGRKNLPKTVELVGERAKELSIKDIIVFTADGDGAFLLREKLANKKTFKIHAATFPYKQVFARKDGEGNQQEFFAQTSSKEIRKRFKTDGINLIQGVMPLQDIIIPSAKDTKIEAINYTLSLISGGMRLCVQAILMAADGGHIEPGDGVIAMSADTAIVARSCLSKWLFHPAHGLEIQEIICKPNCFSITHSTQKKMKEEVD